MFFCVQSVGACNETLSRILGRLPPRISVDGVSCTESGKTDRSRCHTDQSRLSQKLCDTAK